MRQSHPNMFIVFTMLGVVAFATGMGMALTTPRMPTWMSPEPVGALYAACGVVAVIAAMVPSKRNPTMVRSGKVALGLCASLSMAMAWGLIQHFGTPRAVTQSLDRPILYVAFAVMCLAVIREPPSNPVTASGVD